MGRLGDHPNVVTVPDIGEEAGLPYLTRTPGSSYLACSSSA
jgi:hypothetical protein